MSDDPYHYPPDLLAVLVDTIPLLCRAKKDVLTFFRACGVGEAQTTDLASRLARDPASINKYEITRTVLGRLNDLGDVGLRARREAVRRVCEWEDFTTSWPQDALKARGLVAQVRGMVNVKDSFTRLQQEQERERSDRLSEQRRQAESSRKMREARESLRRRLGELKQLDDPHERGRRFETLLNEIFKLDGLSVRDSFTLRLDSGQAAEQIDGLVALNTQLYLVEAKWWKDPLGVDGVAQHLVRVYGRADVHGLIISASGYAPPAIAQCTTALSQKVIVLAEVDELILALERGTNLTEWLKAKTYAASVDRNPLLRTL